MTSKNDKYARKAATSVRRNGHTVRTERYLAFKKGWQQKLSNGDDAIWDKSNADHSRWMADFLVGKIKGDPDAREAILRTFREKPNLDRVVRALLKAEGLI